MNIILSNHFESDTLIFFTALLCIFIIYGILRSKIIAVLIAIAIMLTASYLWIFGYINDGIYMACLIILALLVIILTILLATDKPNYPYNFTDYDNDSRNR